MHQTIIIELSLVSQLYKDCACSIMHSDAYCIILAISTYALLAVEHITKCMASEYIDYHLSAWNKLQEHWLLRATPLELTCY